jgi:hypothetical protein
LAKPNLTLNWDEQMDKNINYCIEGIWNSLRCVQ